MYMLKVCSYFVPRTKPFLTVSVELDDDEDPDATTESLETPVLATEDTQIDSHREPTPTKVHTEPPV